MTLPSRAGRLERREQAVGHLPGAERERDQDRAGGGRRSRWAISSSEASSAQWTSSSMSTTGGASPALQQRAHRAVGVEALVLQPAGGARRRRPTAARAPARRRGRRSAPRAGRSPSGATWSSSASTQIAERQLALELGAAPDEHQRGGAPRRARASSPSSRVLPIPGSPLTTSQRARGAAQAVERGDEAGQLLATPNKGAFSTALDDRHDHGQATH